jgi:hypothetical protein
MPKLNEMKEGRGVVIAACVKKITKIFLSSGI